jgi:Flp pilus assembly protein TadG
VRPPAPSTRPGAASWGADRGSALVGAVAGVTVFLVLLTFAVQLLVNLYATSAVTAAAHDAARSVAAGRVDHDEPAAVAAAVSAGEARARDLLGRAGDRVSFSWEVGADQVRLRVAAEHPALAVGPVARVFGWNRVERDVVVRVERSR